MKMLKIVLGSYILLNSMNLYAENVNECMKYWSEPAVQIRVLPDVQCFDIWEEGFSNENKKVARKIGFNLKDKNWMSTGICNHIQYKNKDYYIYWADMKDDRTDLIMIYNEGNSFAYSRKIDQKNIKNGFRKEDQVDVNLSCGRIGDDIKIASVLNGYIFKETSISNIFKYKMYDRFK